jgi:hypothetical protein
MSKKLLCKKSQAAMEFLMNYGWALLVVLLVIAALAYFGILDPARFLPDKAELGPGLIVSDFSISPKIITLLVRNGLDKTLYGVMINATLCNNGISAISDPVTIPEGGVAMITISCNKTSELKSIFRTPTITNYSTNTYEYSTSRVLNGMIRGKVGAGKYCGNGVLDPQEECDGTVFVSTARCTSKGYSGGPRVCLDNCSLDVSGCYNSGTSNFATSYSGHDYLWDWDFKVKCKTTVLSGCIGVKMDLTSSSGYFTVGSYRILGTADDGYGRDMVYLVDVGGLQGWQSYTPGTWAYRVYPNDKS